MHAFVVLGLFFSIPCQEIGLEKRVRNDLFCVEWGVKPQLSRSVSLAHVVTVMWSVQPQSSVVTSLCSAVYIH